MRDRKEIEEELKKRPDWAHVRALQVELLLDIRDLLATHNKTSEKSG